MARNKRKLKYIADNDVMKINACYSAKKRVFLFYISIEILIFKPVVFAHPFNSLIA